MNLTSIYSYLNERFGFWSYKTGAGFFLISRVIGASFRLYLVALVLDAFVFSKFQIPFWATVSGTILLIWLYSFKGGIKTIVWTDTLQTLFMLISVGFCTYFISREMHWNLGELVNGISSSSLSDALVTDFQKSNHWLKYVISGAFITIVMTGLDQDMMQKNLTCKNEKEARKNVIWMSLSLVPVNLVFLSLGALLYIYGTHQGIVKTEAIGDFPIQILNPDTGLWDGIRKDMLFPSLAISYMGPFIGLVFTIGLIAAAYSSADSALTALTTSFCVDFLGFKEGDQRRSQRYLVHIGFSLLLFVVIVVFRSLHDESIIDTLFKVAGYTYGPILGLYAMGLYTRLKPKDSLIPMMAIVSGVSSFGLNTWLNTQFGFDVGFLILVINGGIMSLLIWVADILTAKEPV